MQSFWPVLPDRYEHSKWDKVCVHLATVMFLGQMQNALAGVKIVPEGGATSPTELARLTDRYAVFTAKRETALLLRRGFEGLVGYMLPYPDVGLEPRTSRSIG